MKVIVPIGNTPDLQSLIDTLIGMKWHAGTTVKLMTVMPRWIEFSTANSTIPSSIQEMEGLACELRNAMPDCDVSFVIREGEPKTEIVNFAQEQLADLILMTGSSSEESNELLSASITQSVVAGAHCPTLVVRPTYNVMADPQGGFKRLLLPVDDSPYADAAIEWLLKFHWNSDTFVTLVSVLEHPSASAVAQTSLGKRVQKLSDVFGNRCRYEVVTGDPTNTIVWLARKYEADLIVIGSHGRTGIHKFLLGSVSEALTRKAPCSVAVVRGILPKDDSWHRTGVFKMPKMFEPAFSGLSSPGSRRPGDLPQLMPGGMG